MFKEKKQNIKINIKRNKKKKQAPEFKKHLTRQITKTFNNKTWNNCIQKYRAKNQSYENYNI